MRLVFLGTGGSYPSPKRNVASTAIVKDSRTILLDCGEGTQRQLMRSSVSFMSVDKIFISHLHADHFLGVPGLIQSMKLNQRTEPLEIYGPRGTRSMLETLVKLGYFRPDFDVISVDIEPTALLRFSGYSIEALGVEHSIPALGYRFQEDQRPGRFDKPRALELGVPEGPLFGELQKGQKVVVDGRTIHPEDVLGPPRRGRVLVYSGDTKPCLSVKEASKNADVLVHESTFDQSMSEKAIENDHSSVDMAAVLAKEAKVGKLFLVHISPRYDNVKPLLKTARKIFPGTKIPRDMEEYTL
ncbi:MAG: ribonuclease Z [Thermoplasmata archaeon]